MARLYAQGWLTPARRVSEHDGSDDNNNGGDDEKAAPAPHPMNNGRQIALPTHCIG
jgi:hypothetical protein